MSVERRLDVIPVITLLKDHLETIRRSELKRIRGRFGRLSSDQEVAIESLTRGIVNSIVDVPIRALENSACDVEAITVVDTVARLFDLRPSPE
jgi:glutamyl-tRNA reductase